MFGSMAMALAFVAGLPHQAWAGGPDGDDTCLEISLTGTMGGPPQVGGLMYKALASHLAYFLHLD